MAYGWMMGLGQGLVDAGNKAIPQYQEARAAAVRQALDEQREANVQADRLKSQQLAQAQLDESLRQGQAQRENWAADTRRAQQKFAFDTGPAFELEKRKLEIEAAKARAAGHDAAYYDAMSRKADLESFQTMSDTLMDTKADPILQSMKERLARLKQDALANLLDPSQKTEMENLETQFNNRFRNFANTRLTDANIAAAESGVAPSLRAAFRSTMQGYRAMAMTPTTPAATGNVAPSPGVNSMRDPALNGDTPGIPAWAQTRIPRPGQPAR